jgi:uncharacterized protein (DUF427 family)
MEAVRDYPHPPRIERTGARVGRVIVDSDRCRRVLETSHPPVYCVPRNDIADGVLTPGQGRSYCEFKGVAGYWTSPSTTSGRHGHRSLAKDTT